MKTGLYSGEVVHQRFAPRRHRLCYRIFMMLIDLGRVEEDLRPLRFLSHNRFNLFSFHDRDHGPDQADRSGTLYGRMTAMLRQQGRLAEGDRLFLLTMPRVLGFVFNPICLYFVTNWKGQVTTVVYEVNNTFGDRHSYVLPALILPASAPDRQIHQTAPKRLHVSPFMDTRDMVYDFALSTPAETFTLNIHLRRTTGQDMLFAGFMGQRQALDDATLWRLFFGLPLMTLKVVAGIHWEALRIALKGIALKPKPVTERSAISAYKS
ncbi:MAG: DUF1365 domain-containing protein [Asticcacaulis sp.]|uniref:DUF1365 domain-containing protein n=1 Tax=Asticcacaulis sp. TaxID=1872648 RepID=UPI0039E62BB1